MNTKAIKKQKIVGLKELRENMEQCLDAVDRGERLTVVRRSKHVFTIIPPDEDEDQWETLIDFTEANNGRGISAKKLLKLMDGMHG